MKTVNVRELHTAMPNLKEFLALEHELLLTDNGEPVARILPLVRQRQVPSLATHRAGMATLPEGSLVRLVRQDRDRA